MHKAPIIKKPVDLGPVKSDRETAIDMIVEALLDQIFKP